MTSDLHEQLFAGQPLTKNLVVGMFLSLDGAVLQEHKYFLGIERGYAVSVPEAVGDVLEKCLYEGMNHDEEFLSGKLRIGMIAGYISRGEKEPLIFNVKQRGGMTAQMLWESEEAWHERLARNSHSFVSKERVSRLEGDLRRFGAQIYHKDPREVAVTPELIQTYCQWYNVLPLRDKMMDASGFNGSPEPPTN